MSRARPTAAPDVSCRAAVTVRWVFQRGAQQTRIEVTCRGRGCVVAVHKPDGSEHQLTSASIIDAMLEQAVRERELTASGWALIEFHRLRE